MMTNHCQAFCSNVLKHSATLEKDNKTYVRYVDVAPKYKENVLLYTFWFSTCKNLCDPQTGITWNGIRFHKLPDIIQSRTWALTTLYKVQKVAGQPELHKKATLPRQESYDSLSYSISIIPIKINIRYGRLRYILNSKYWNKHPAYRRNTDTSMWRISYLCTVTKHN